MIKNRIDNGVETSSSDTGTSDSKKDDGTVIPSSSSKADSDKGGLLKLPQTGEEKAKWAVSIVGILLVIGAIVFVVKRNKTGKVK